jgi:MFS family permease
LDTRSTEAETSPRSPGLSRVFAVGLGNALEFYDFLTFSFFAVQIGHCFFPATQTKRGLLYSLATFGVGFVTRPVGGFVLGRYADKKGRKPAMLLSFVLMGIAITGLALTPPFERIGIVAPILLVVFRLVQGFALGGEVGPSTAYLIEIAPADKRGLYVSLQYMTQDLSVLVAGLVGYVLSVWLEPRALDAWGWRAAFLFGALIVPVGLVIRSRLPESLEQTESADLPPPAKVPLSLAVAGVATLGSIAVTLYVSDYVATFAQDRLHLPASDGLLAIVVLGLSTLVIDPVSGLLSDRIGRRPVMLTGATLLTLSAVPIFYLLVSHPSALTLCVATGVLGTLAGFTASPALVSLTESFPHRVRAGTLGTVYAVALALFGGTTQFAVKWLTDFTGSGLAPAFYVTGAMLLGLVAMSTFSETAPVKIKR